MGLFYGPLIIAMFITAVEIYKESYRPQLISPAESKAS